MKRGTQHTSFMFKISNENSLALDSKKSDWKKLSIELCDDMAFIRQACIFFDRQKISFKTSLRHPISGLNSCANQNLSHQIYHQLAVFLFVAIFSESFFPFMRRNLRSFSLFSARHFSTSLTVTSVL